MNIACLHKGNTSLVNAGVKLERFGGCRGTLLTALNPLPTTILEVHDCKDPTEGPLILLCCHMGQFSQSTQAFFKPVLRPRQRSPNATSRLCHSLWARMSSQNGLKAHTPRHCRSKPLGVPEESGSVKVSRESLTYLWMIPYVPLDDSRLPCKVADPMAKHLSQAALFICSVGCLEVLLRES